MPQAQEAYVKTFFKCRGSLEIESANMRFLLPSNTAYVGCATQRHLIVLTLGQNTYQAHLKHWQINVIEFASILRS